MKKLSQAGFTAVEIVLSVALVTAIAAAGYFAYQNASNHKAVATPSPTATASTPTPTVAAAAASTLKISELGVSLVNVPASLKDMVYVTSLNNGAASFSTTSLTNLDNSCSATNGPIGAIGIVNGQYDKSMAAQGEMLKQFSKFWVSYSHPQATCGGNNTTAEALHGTQTDTFKTLVTNPANIQLSE